MFESKHQKTVSDLTHKLNLLQEENFLLLSRQKDYDFLEQNGLMRIIGYDYSMLLTFEGTVVISTTIRVKEGKCNYCIDIEKNNKLVESYIIYNHVDGGIISHMANTRRKNTYELVKNVAKFIEMQTILYRDRMGYKCSVLFEDRLPGEYMELLDYKGQE